MRYEPIHRNSRKLFCPLVVLCLALVSACTPTAQSTQPSATVVEATVTTIEAVVEEGEGNVSVVATSESGRIIQHYLGETTIPISATRIVAIDLADNLLALDTTPLASGDWEQDF